MHDSKPIDTRIESLGEAKIKTPLLHDSIGSSKEMFKSDKDRMLIDVLLNLPDQEKKSTLTQASSSAHWSPAAVCAPA